MTRLNKNSIITIIGAGRLGCAIGQLLLDHDYMVRIGIKDNSTQKSKELQETFSGRSKKNLSITTNRAAVRDSDLTLITVQDEFIEHVCQSISKELKPDSLVAHCSGLHDSSILITAQQSGARICSLHPLNTFPSHAAAKSIFANSKHQTALYGEGNESAINECFDFFSGIGFKCQEIDSESKPLYHAASVVACNYLVTLMDISLSISDAAGLDRNQFWQSLQPIIDTTIRNIGQHGTGKALSGPVVRGDINTIKKHIEALEQTNPALADCYIALARHSLNLVENNNQLSEASKERLRNMLN